MKILVVDDDEAIRQYLIVTLENILSESDIIESVSGNEAIKLLSSDPYFELIISDYNMPKGDGFLIVDYVIENKINIPLIMHTTENINELPKDVFSQSEQFNYIKKGKNFVELKEALTSLDTLKNHKSFKTIDSEYKKIRIFYFWRFNKTLSDVYLKLNDTKYLKIFNKGDSYGPSDIDKYVEKKQEHLYIKTSDYENFAVTLGKQPFLAFDSDLPIEEKIQRTNQIVQKMIQSTGISQGAIIIAEKNIEALIQETKKYKKLSSLLKLMQSKENYIQDHSLFLSYLCSFLSEKLNWNARRSKEKLCLAALLHDVTLTDPDLAMVDSYNLEDLENFSEKQKQEFFDHPKKVASMLDELAIDYPNLDTIIEQHHETIDGTGFPRKIGFSQLGPLPSLFIFCHDFVNQFYKKDFDPDSINDIKKVLKARYTQGQATKIIEVFLKCF